MSNTPAELFPAASRSCGEDDAWLAGADAPRLDIDLRSDFLARRTPAMLLAAGRAEGDFRFGLREDPRQKALERRIADLTGHQDALVFPTCTMANLTALLLLGRPGTRVLVQPEAHVLLSEAGGLAAIAGLIGVPVASGDAPRPEMPELAAWREAAGSGDAQRPAASVLVLENTHNRAGGAPVDASYTGSLLSLASELRIAAHLDGARIFDAAVALGVSISDLTSGFDTVSLSLNKGVGAPIAAALAGSRATIADALVIRQRLGGGIRPTGPDAASSLAALDDLGHFAESHRRARRLAIGLAAIDGLHVDVDGVRTCIVVAHIVRAGLDAEALAAQLAGRGLGTLPFGPRRVRFVTYRGIEDEDVDRAIAIVTAALADRAAVGDRNG